MARGKLIKCRDCPHFAEGVCVKFEKAVGAADRACETLRKIHRREYMKKYFQQNIAKRREYVRMKRAKRSIEGGNVENENDEQRAKFLKEQAERDRLAAEFTRETVRKLPNGRTIITRR